MHCVIFTRALVSDWNHGNAHFARGLVTEMVGRGWQVSVFEPGDGWSRRNLIEQHGLDAVEAFESRYPDLRNTLYDTESINLDRALDGADIVLVHAWNDTDLVALIGRHHARKGCYRLFFHDTHHRMVTAPETMAAYDLRNYDGVLAYGEVLRDLYKKRFGCAAWTWHEAADIKTFYPHPAENKEGDLVWVGNWGDEERADELREFLIQPVIRLGIKASIYGVRYPDSAIAELRDAGIEYKGCLPNYKIPEIFARHRVTVHIPRRPYRTLLPGIPTIRPFEAMACGIPLISSPWEDSSGLFERGRDYLLARDSQEMTDLLRTVLRYPNFAASLARNGLRSICARHTCAHRVDELIGIVQQSGQREALRGAA